MVCFPESDLGESYSRTLQKLLGAVSFCCRIYKTNVANFWKFLEFLPNNADKRLTEAPVTAQSIAQTKHMNQPHIALAAHRTSRKQNSSTSSCLVWLLA